MSFSVFVLVPVFNRLHHTKTMVECLRAQKTEARLVIVIINDGSTDGTADYLAGQPDLVALKGDGTLFWGGAMECGLQYALPLCSTDDYILFLNNDTYFAPGYVDELVRSSRENGDAAVGSMIHDADAQPPLVSIGARVDVNRIRVTDIIDELSAAERADPAAFYFPDALSGRGTLFPASVFDKYGTLMPKLLPHYFADYELSMRFRRKGVRLVVSRDGFVVSPPVYGNSTEGMSLRERLFSIRSSGNLRHTLTFFCLIGTPTQRVTAPLRLLVKAIWQGVRR
ncbi:glycosyltransferase family 2 protein [Rhizobium leguminosarum]|uniref:glycosyltransferase family 2 protein n=1 Tax=Rhizobium leguminosarum TaxID=384 RepID=UPI001C94D7DF|nr:glycosyltransferase family 2 protein [Rhizobium leguminosarum]MBY5766733.1 glycosyltransferase family 2 protein [Rhizobium leguminosarum]